MIELDWKISNLAICLTAASLGGLKVGFDLGVLNPCLKYVSEDLSLAAYQEGLIMVLLIVSATFGALASGRIADGVGMISAQALAAIFGGAGSAISAAAFGPSGVWVMALGRFISGLGCGACTVLCPRYIAEVSPKGIRGALSCATQLSICLGQLLAYSLALPYEYGMETITIAHQPVQWWRVVHIIGALVALFQFVMASKSIESPEWLEHHGSLAEARVNRAKLMGAPIGSVTGVDLPFGLNASAIVDPLLPTIQEETRPRPVRQASLKEIFSTPQYRYSSFLAIGVAAFQQLSGINTVMLYSEPILESAGLGSPIMGTVVVGLINLGMTILAAGLVDGHGRRKILALSHAGCALSVTVLALAGLRHDLGLVVVLAMLAFVAAFAVGAGPVPFMYIPEVLAPSINGLVGSAAMAGNWSFNVAVVGLFPVCQSHFGLGGTYAVYAVLNAVAVVFCSYFMVETRQLTMPEIQEAIIKRAGPEPEFFDASSV